MTRAALLLALAACVDNEPPCAREHITIMQGVYGVVTFKGVGDGAPPEGVYPGVTVTAFTPRPEDALVGSTTTSELGIYQLELPAGRFQIVVQWPISRYGVNIGGVSVPLDGLVGVDVELHTDETVRTSDPDRGATSARRASL